METDGLTVLSCHACPTREWASDALLWQRTPQSPSFNVARGLASGGRLAPVGHVAAPDPGVGGRAHRGTWRLRTPARAGSGGPEVRACGTRGGTGPGGRRPRPQGHVAVPDPCPSGEWRSGGQPCGTRGGAGPWGRRPHPQGLARAADSYPNRVLGPGPLASSMTQTSWRSGFHL